MTAATERPPITPGAAPAVALFVTCLVDLMRPEVGFAALRLLEAAGCRVYVPRNQTCCGQPAYNSGDYDATAPVARDVIRCLETADHVVVPSGSCAGMLVRHYPRLLDGTWRERAQALAARTWELTSFLGALLPARADDARPPGDAAPTVAYHDGCAGLRELAIHAQPRRLLARAGVAVRDIDQSEVCCGFGGTFCARMPAISGKMASDKLEAARRSGTRTLVGGDLGCLLSLAGRASRTGIELDIRHVAELLDGRLEAPPIGQPRQS